MPRAASSGAGLGFGDGTPDCLGVPPAASPAPSVPGDSTHQARPSCISPPLPHSSSTTPPEPFPAVPGASLGVSGRGQPNPGVGGTKARPSHPRCLFLAAVAPEHLPRVTPPRISRGTPVTAPRWGGTGPRGPEQPEGQRGTAQGHRGRRARVPRGPGCGLATPASLRSSGSVAPARPLLHSARGGKSTLVLAPSDSGSRDRAEPRRRRGARARVGLAPVRSWMAQGTGFRCGAGQERGHGW